MFNMVSSPDEQQILGIMKELYNIVLGTQIFTQKSDF